MFALAFTRKIEKYKVWQMALIFLIPAVTLGLCWTNDAHHLIWSNFIPQPGNFLIYEKGSFFWIMLIYVYTGLMSGFLLLVTSLRKLEGDQRKQQILIVIGSVFPFASNILYIMPFNPFPGFDTTPISFSIAGLLIAWSLFQFRMFELLPMAKEMLIESMNDGVLVLDYNGFVKEANPAAIRLLHKTPQIEGKAIEEIFSDHPEIINALQNQLESQFEMVVDRERNKCLDCRIVHLTDDKGMIYGKLITLHDITKYQQVVYDLKQQYEIIETIFDASPLPIVITDNASRIVDINQKGIHFFGLIEKHTLIGTTFLNLIDSSDSQQAQADVESILQDKQVAQKKYRFLIRRNAKSDETTVIVAKAHINVVNDENEEPAYLVYIIQTDS